MPDSRNTAWSDRVQGIDTLYYSRKLRFSEPFGPRFREAIPLTPDETGALLEVGCGPGALSERLHVWYPGMRIVGIDRDDAFIAFAKEKAPEAEFLVGDAERLPFDARTFDVTLSHTVSEHVETAAFFGEQYRVLKPGGRCVVLSSRKSIVVKAPCLQPDETERAFWKEVGERDTSFQDVGVCRYPLNEAQLPLAMEKYGFKSVSVRYVTVDLTPDDPATPDDFAAAIFAEGRKSELESVASAERSLPGVFTEERLSAVRRRILEKYSERESLYRAGIRQWDTLVTVIMVMSGEKK